MTPTVAQSRQQHIRDVEDIALQDYNDVESIGFYQTPTHSYSGLLRDSEKSLRVQICADHNDANFLHKLLHHLVECKENYSNVMNLLFHGIEWQTEGVQLLCSFLGPGSSVKQVEFQKNMFGTRSAAALGQFSEILQRNSTINTVVFSECKIGSTGATLLALALANNRSVEEFQIWEDSIGSRGAEELSKMIEVNYTLKLLIMFDHSPITAAPLISGVLARNRRVEVHIWGRDCHIKGGMNSSKIVEFTPETGNMRIYSNINSTGLQRVACALAWNTTVTTLDMSGIPLKSKWTKELRGALERNRSLKIVKLTRCGLGDKAVVYVAAGLFKNKCLESLSLDGNCFGGVGLEHLLCPLSTFSPLQRQANTTLKFLSFGGKQTKIGRYGIAAILQVLETNQSLVQLAICDDTSLTPNDVVRIFISLERNATVRSISLKGCRGVEGEVVLQTIMGTLEVNPWIEEIDLYETPLHVSGRTGPIYEKLGQNANLVPANDSLDLPLTAPTCCRVFLCGQEFAGKSTLCNSIYNSMNSTKLPHMDALRTQQTPNEQMARTNEIMVKAIHDGNTKLTIWNLGGHDESFSLLDFMFVAHGGPSFFIIVSSLFRKPSNKDPKSVEEVESELTYWLKFLVSNSRKIAHSILPHVTVVLTHFDKAPHLQEGLQPIATLMQKLREDFRAFADIYHTVFAVDCRSLVSVSKLIRHLQKTTKTIVQQVPQVYEVCNDVINILHDWRIKNFNKAVIRWFEFCEICQLNVPVLRLRSRRDNVEKVDSRRRAVAKSLQNLGEIIFFQELGVLIINCEWFCQDFLSQLTTLKSVRVGATESDGFVRKQELEKILEEKLCNQISRSHWSARASLQASDIINMLLELELCYEQDHGNPNNLLLLPAILGESKGTRRWQLSMPECRYAGRHLECEDTHMFLTTDFFPRLQVRLHNKIMCLTQQQGAVYNLEKNLIYTVINGVHVRVELGMKLGSSVDVLACSNKSVNDMLTLLHQLIIPTVLNLAPSMTFKESIIRPDCVKYLVPQRFWTTQHLPLKKIKQILVSLPADSMYDYQHTWSAVERNKRLILNSGSDYARDLLSDDDFHEVLHRRYYDLQHLATELAVTPNNLQESETISQADVVEPSVLGIAKGVEMVLRRLKTIEQGIRDLKEEIISLRYYEHHLVTELHRKMDYVMNYNIQLEERKVPQMFYFVTADNRSRRLVTRMLPGMRALRVHMLCEFRREMHVVEDQVGCELIQVDNQAVKCLLPYMSKFMKLLTFALKIGAHFIVGMGEMIPDLSREVVHLLDSSIMYGAATSALSVGALGAALMRGKGRNNSSQSSGSNMGEDMRAARQWLVDFLKGQGIATGMDIAQRFGLWRVRYREDGHIAWICRKHVVAREDEIFELPL